MGPAIVDVTEQKRLNDARESQIPWRKWGPYLSECDADGLRPVYGGSRKFQDDPHWRDLILFYEYFHGDNGAGLGASHQTGWSALVAPLLDLFGRVDAKLLLESERGRLEARLIRQQVSGEKSVRLSSADP